MLIYVKDYNIDSYIFMDPRRAEPLFEKIRDTLERDEEVILSFKDLKIVIGAVLHVAIGKLYDPSLTIGDKVDRLVKFTDATDSILEYIDIVKANAQKFYLDRACEQRISERKKELSVKNNRRIWRDLIERN